MAARIIAVDGYGVRYSYIILASVVTSPISVISYENVTTFNTF